MKNRSNKHEHSSGGVILRNSRKGLEVCLISTQGGQRWQLPKGHIEKGEDSIEAALREVFEETGCRGQIIDIINKIDFAYEVTHLKKKVKRHKDVYFYLMEYTSGDAGSDDREVVDARWIPVGEAIDKLTFDNERTVLQKGLVIFENRNVR